MVDWNIFWCYWYFHGLYTKIQHVLSENNDLNQMIKAMIHSIVDLIFCHIHITRMVVYKIFHY